jgi:hypothetical protein
MCELVSEILFGSLNYLLPKQTSPVRSSAFSFVDERCKWDFDAILAVGNPEPYKM